MCIKHMQCSDYKVKIPQVAMFDQFYATGVLNSKTPLFSSKVAKMLVYQHTWWQKSARGWMFVNANKATGSRLLSF